MAFGKFKVKFGVQVSDSATPDGYDLVPVGTMMYWAGPAASIPSGWLPCDGAVVSRDTYPNLHALMWLAGYPYGSGDGSTTFVLPDARGRALRHGTFPTVYTGSETYTLVNNNIVTHTHTLNTHSHSNLNGHTHAASAHSHGGGSHTHTFPHGHDSSGQSGGHTHQAYIESNVNPGTANLRTSIAEPGTLYTVHASGGGNHSHGGVTTTNGTTSFNDFPFTAEGTTSTATSSSADSSTGPSSSSNTGYNNGSSTRSSFSLIQPFLTVNLIIKA